MRGRLRIPPEWERHACCWLAFPHLREEWPYNLDAAQRAIATLSRKIAEEGNEPVRLLVPDAEAEGLARNLAGESRQIEYVRASYGDCWVRDTLPVLGTDASGQLGALLFSFNGWGGKFEIPGDSEIGRWVAEHTNATTFVTDLVLEGGAVEFDGEGTMITTAACVLNPNRNPGLDRKSFESTLSGLVDVDRTIWLERGLGADHTDGHVDMVARFVAPKTVVCAHPSASGPDATARGEISQALAESGLSVIYLPSPGEVSSPKGDALPANYCNFYIANDAVLVPEYGVPEDEAAQATIANIFARRTVIGLDARDLLWGGGAFHCVTQPQPWVS